MILYSVPSGHLTRFYCIKLILFFLVILYIAKHSYLHLCLSSLLFLLPLFQESYALNWISILEQKEISSPFPHMKKLNVKFGLIESLLKSVSGGLCFIYVFFPPLLLSLLLLFALSDKRRQPAKQGCSGTNLSITADGTLTTCTLKIKLALKAGA